MAAKELTPTDVGTEDTPSDQEWESDIEDRELEGPDFEDLSDDAQQECLCGKTPFPTPECTSLPSETNTDSSPVPPALLQQFLEGTVSTIPISPLEVDSLVATLRSKDRSESIKCSEAGYLYCSTRRIIAALAIPETKLSPLDPVVTTTLPGLVRNKFTTMLSSSETQSTKQ